MGDDWLDGWVDGEWSRYIDIIPVARGGGFEGFERPPPLKNNYHY